MGRRLESSLACVGDLVSLDRKGGYDKFDNPLCGNLEDLEGIAQTIRYVKPHVIVNAAAYTDVDRAERDVTRANLVNFHAVQVLAQEAAAMDCLLIHYSTDYVFDGSGDLPWTESDTTSPLNAYGRSKLSGERAILSSGCRFHIYRTSWVFDAQGKNFANTMLRLAASEKILRVVNDQYGVPTSAKFIAETTAKILSDQKDRLSSSEIYNLVPNGETTWHEYAEFLLEQARKVGVDIATERVEAVSSSEYPTHACRPNNSRLNNRKLRDQFSVEVPEWKQGVVDFLKDINCIEKNHSHLEEEVIR